MLKDKNVVIAAHIYATGPALELEEYLIDKTKNLLFIGQPFSYSKNKNSFYRKYNDGNGKYEGSGIGENLPNIIFYLRDFLFTIIWTFKIGGKIDVFIGSDNFLSFTGLILKFFGKVDKVIFYTIDFVPKRFENQVLNNIYHFFDRVCLKYCHIVWNVSEEITKARKEQMGIEGDGWAKQIEVPLGVWYERFPYKNWTDRNKNEIVFMGHILEKQGLQKVIEAMPLILKTNKLVRLKIIGGGTYENELKKLVTKLNLIKYVSFVGFIEDHKKVEELLCESVISVATYEPKPGSFTYFADPGKIKNYLAAGLIVITTNVPAISRELQRNECGTVVDYDAKSISEAVLSFLENERKLKKYCGNARVFAKRFDWNTIFAKAIKTSL